MVAQFSGTRNLIPLASRKRKRNRYRSAGRPKKSSKALNPLRLIAMLDTLSKRAQVKLNPVLMSKDVSYKNRKRRRDLFNGHCAYCGQEQSFETMTLDHFIPKAKFTSGKANIFNLLPACYDCNHAKQDDNVLKWYAMQPFFSEKRWREMLWNLGDAEVVYLITELCTQSPA